MIDKQTKSIHQQTLKAVPVHNNGQQLKDHVNTAEGGNISAHQNPLITC